MPYRKRLEDEFDINVYPGFRTGPAPYIPAPIGSQLEPYKSPIPEEQLPILRGRQYQLEPPEPLGTPEQLSLPERLRLAYSQMPTREEHKPSIARRVGAAIIGVGSGAGAAQSFNAAPYQGAYQDWARERVGPLQQEYAMEEASMKERLEGRKVDIEGRKVDLAERGVVLAETAAPSVVAQTQAETKFINGWKDRIPQSDLESLLELYKEDPESASNFIKTRFPQQLSFGERQQLQNDLINSRERIVRRQQAGAKERAVIAGAGRQETPAREFEYKDAKNRVFDRMVNDPEFSDYFFDDKDKDGEFTRLRTVEEIMEEFDITEEQAMEDLENINSKFDEEYSKELKKVQSITGGRYKIED